MCTWVFVCVCVHSFMQFCFCSFVKGYRGSPWPSNTSWTHTHTHPDFSRSFGWLIVVSPPNNFCISLINVQVYNNNNNLLRRRKWKRIRLSSHIHTIQQQRWRRRRCGRLTNNTTNSRYVPWDMNEECTRERENEWELGEMSWDELRPNSKINKNKAKTTLFVGLSSGLVGRYSVSGIKKRRHGTAS